MTIVIWVSLILVGALTVVALAVAGYLLRQRRAAFAQVKAAASEDVTVLGEDIAALDLDVGNPTVDPAAVHDYRGALDAYERAKRRLDAARSKGDLPEVTKLVDDGHYSLACARARLAGEAVPSHRPPCFFNPQHGTSVEDVQWAPPGGVQRAVPACAADADRLRAGEPPQSRVITVGKRKVVYWETQSSYSYSQWSGGSYSTGGPGDLAEMLSQANVDPKTQELIRSTIRGLGKNRRRQR
jgi:hypothetical protein